ncbi:MAG TPA: TolC family protein [Geobacteraceae bacterium]
MIQAALLLLLATGTAAADNGGEVRLSLKDAIRMAAEKNLDVRAELYNPAAAEADIHKYEGIYNPLLSALVNYQDSSTLLANRFTSGGAGVSRLRSTAFNAGVSQLIPTGGTLGAAFNNSWNHNNFGGGALNNYFQSNLTLSYAQPLLRNFGTETTELNITVAKLGKEGALDQFRSRLLSIVSQVRTQYFQLYSARENLKVKKTSLELAERILNDTRAQVKAGVLPAFEVLNAQFGVATQQKNVIDAERAVKDQSDALRVLLQIPDSGEIVPEDTPSQDAYAMNEAEAVQRALAGRPDLLLQRVALTTNELQARVAGNQTLPQLDLTTSAAFTGLSDTYSRDLERVSSGQYPIWTVGLQLTYPIGNDAARNDYIKSKLRVEQSRTQVRSLEETISRDVRTALRAVSSSYKQLDVTSRGRAYAEEVLQAYIKKQKVGLATTKDVLDVLNNQVTAEGNQIQAVADYNNAITALWTSTGELLDREGVRVSARDADELYGKSR